MGHDARAGRHNASLGWRLTPAMSAIAADGTSLLSAQLTDSTGAAISGAIVRVAALRVARAYDVHDMTLTPSAGTGNYAVRFDARRAGQWELRFDVTLGAEHFTQVSRVEAFAGEVVIPNAVRNPHPPDRGAPRSGR